MTNEEALKKVRKMRGKKASVRYNGSHVTPTYCSYTIYGYIDGNYGEGKNWEDAFAYAQKRHEITPSHRDESEGGDERNT